MGENEQGGMLRTVVVVGLVALIAVVITMGVVGMKASLRTNTLMGLTMGQNVLTIDQSDVGKRFNVLGGNEKLSYDADSGIYTLVLSTKSGYDTSSERGKQGMYYGDPNEPRTYDKFKPGDKYYMTADIKTTSDVSLMPNVWHGMYFEASQSDMRVNPDITNSWQHYETKGIRLRDDWGSPVFQFVNNTDQPITFQIKNVKLVREA